MAGPPGGGGGFLGGLLGGLGDGISQAKAQKFAQEQHRQDELFKLMVGSVDHGADPNVVFPEVANMILGNTGMVDAKGKPSKAIAGLLGPMASLFTKENLGGLLRGLHQGSQAKGSAQGSTDPSQPLPSSSSIPSSGSPASGGVQFPHMLTQDEETAKAEAAKRRDEQATQQLIGDREIRVANEKTKPTRAITPAAQEFNDRMEAAEKAAEDAGQPFGPEERVAVATKFREDKAAEAAKNKPDTSPEGRRVKQYMDAHPDVDKSTATQRVATLMEGERQQAQSDKQADRRTRQQQSGARLSAYLTMSRAQLAALGERTNEMKQTFPYTLAAKEAGATAADLRVTALTGKGDATDRSNARKIVANATKAAQTLYAKKGFLEKELGDDEATIRRNLIQELSGGQDPDQVEQLASSAEPKLSAKPKASAPTKVTTPNGTWVVTPVPAQ